MRWIFLCLIGFNVVYFSWQQWLVYEQSREVVPARVEAVQGGESPVLLTERLPEMGSPAPPPTIGLGAPSPVHQGVDHVDHKKEALCPYVGPYSDEPDAGSLVNVLIGDGYTATAHAVEVSKNVESWVLIPPRASRKESLQLLKKLQANKIDSYLVAEGENKNAISLGLFSQPSSAKGVHERMKAAGYAVEIQTLEQLVYEYWVRVDVGNETKERQALLEKALIEEKNVSFSKSLCERFAQH